MRMLERRVASLEESARVCIEPVFVIRHLVAVGRVGAPMMRAECEGATILREAGETDAAFTARVQARVVSARPDGTSFQILMS